MDQLKQFSNNISQLNNNWASVIDEFFNKFESDFIDMIQDQLLHGEDGAGNKLQEYASGIYSSYKKTIGSISSPVADLKVTGDFYDGMYLNKFNEIDSTDWKTSKLIEKYGDSILDPQEDRLNNFVNEQIIPELMDFLETKLMMGI